MRTIGLLVSVDSAIIACSLELLDECAIWDEVVLVTQPAPPGVLIGREQFRQVVIGARRREHGRVRHHDDVPTAAEFRQILLQVGNVDRMPELS